MDNVKQKAIVPLVPDQKRIDADPYFEYPFYLPDTAAIYEDDTEQGVLIHRRKCAMNYAVCTNDGKETVKVEKIQLDTAQKQVCLAAELGEPQPLDDYDIYCLVGCFGAAELKEKYGISCKELLADLAEDEDLPF